MPGRLTFATTADGAASPTERLRITAQGRLTLYNSEGIQLSVKTSGLYATNGALSYYGTTNGVYLNGAGDTGWLRVQAAGSQNDRTSINLVGHSASANADTIYARTNSTERLRIDSNGRSLFSGTLGYANIPFGGNPANAAIQIRCNSKYNGIAFGEGAVSGAIGLGGAESSTAMVFVANAHPANLGGGTHDTFEWLSLIHI